jgi:hypothetical protein
MNAGRLLLNVAVEFGCAVPDRGKPYRHERKHTENCQFHHLHENEPPAQYPVILRTGAIGLMQPGGQSVGRSGSTDKSETVQKVGST